MPARTYSFSDCGCSGLDGAEEGDPAPCNPTVATDSCDDCASPPACDHECTTVTFPQCRPPMEGEPEGGVCEDTAIDPCTSIYVDRSEDCCGAAGPATYIPNIRLNLTGLTNGVAYTATAHFISPTLATTTVVWNFTATGTTETTSYEAFPTPDATDTQWGFDHCTIEEAA